MSRFIVIKILGILLAGISLLVMIWFIHNKDTATVSSEDLSEQEIETITNGDLRPKTAIKYAERKLLLTYITPSTCGTGIKSLRIQGDYLLVKVNGYSGECAGSLGGPYHRVINLPEDFANNKNAKVVFLNLSTHGKDPIAIHHR